MLISVQVPAAKEPAGLPEFASDHAADQWLRQNSGEYRRFCEVVDARGGYVIEATEEYPGGVAYTENGKGHIGLNGALKGAHRLSVMIFELTNLYQEDRHQEVAERVRCGELTDETEFALLREMVEFDGLRLHRGVLVDLERAAGAIPPEMISWVSLNARTLAGYELPYAYDYLKAQAASGHTDHYRRLFAKHRAEAAARAPVPPR